MALTPLYLSDPLIPTAFYLHPAKVSGLRTGSPYPPPPPRSSVGLVTTALAVFVVKMLKTDMEFKHTHSYLETASSFIQSC